MPPRAPENDAGGGSSDAATNTAAAAVVRLALFHEYRRAPLKRQAIRAVLPNNTNFNAVFARAQQTLAATFGMQLVEMRARMKGDAADERAEETQTQAATQRRKGKRRAADNEDEDEDEEADTEGDEDAARAKGKKRPKTGTYILRNVLPSGIVAALSTPQDLPLPMDENGEEIDDEAYAAELEADSGALLPWDRADVGSSVELLGIRTVILCLILTMGRSADDLKLMSLMRRLGLQRDTILPFGSPDSHAPHLTLEKYMDLLARQNYLEKIKAPNPAAPEGFSIEWRWGAREVEFSEEAALAFIERIFLDPESSGEDSGSDDEAREARERGQRRRRQRTAEEKQARFQRKKKQLRVDVERAAGGPLVGEL